MKIKIIKQCTFSGKTFRPGKSGINHQVETSLGESLIESGDAVSNEFVSERERLAAGISIEKAMEILSELPRKARDIIKDIKTIVNKPALNMLATEDHRSTVRKAALIRLEEL